jgi:hypothetical protein
VTIVAADLARRTPRSGDDLAAKWGMPFTKLMKLKPGETVIFAFIVFKSRAHRAVAIGR